jgi:hypothetical protein
MTALRNARNVIRNGNYATALTELAKIDAKELDERRRALIGR